MTPHLVKQMKHFTVAALRVLPLLLTLLAAAALLRAEGAVAQGPTLIGVDAKVADNGASVIGKVDSCVEVEVGDTFPLDIYVGGAEGLRAWELRFVFNHAVVKIIDHDFNLFLLTTAPSGSVFPSLFEVEKPDRYFLAAAEFRTPDSGSGVLTRLTLEAVAAGRSPAAIATDPAYLSPRLTDTETNGDELFGGPISQAEVAVGEPCAAGAPKSTPTPAPPDPAPNPTPAPSPDTDGRPGPTSTPASLVLLPAGERTGEEDSALQPPSAVALSDSPPRPQSDQEADEQQEPSEEEGTSGEPGEAERPTDDSGDAADPGARPPSSSGNSFDGLSIWMLGPILAAAVVGAGGIVIVLSLRNR